MTKFSLLTAGFILLAIPAFSQVGDFALPGGEATFEGLGDLPGGSFYSRAQGVSADGSVVVGVSLSGNGSGNADEAFRWTESGGMQGLGALPGEDFDSAAEGVSDDGSVVVGSSYSEAFRWTEAGGIEGLGFLPGAPLPLSYVEDVSDDGSVVVGASLSGNGGEAFRWTEDGGMQGLGDLSGGDFYSFATATSADGSVIVGGSISENGGEAFLRTEAGGMEGLGDLPGSSVDAAAYGVSADGSVVVGIGLSENGYEAFRWTESNGMEGLGDLPGGLFDGSAGGVSADGSIVIGQSHSENGYEAFIWTEKEGMRSLKEVLESDYDLDLTGWTLVAALDISSDGRVIVGFGTNPNGDTEGWWVEAPFPVADEATPEALTDVLGVPSPNPVRETSTLTIAVERGQGVVVEVFDVTGRWVQTLYNGTLAAGMSETLMFDTSALPAGLYMVRATGEDFLKTRRVTVVR